MKKRKPPKKHPEFEQADFDTVLKRMLETPPTPKKDIKASRAKKLGKVLPK